MNFKKALAAVCLILCIGCQNSNNTRGRAIFFDPSWPNTPTGSRRANVTGLTIDLIGHDEKSSYQFSAHDGLLHQLEQKECAAIIASIPMNGVNKEKFAFSDPLVETGPVFVTNTDKKLLGSHTFENQKIALGADSPAYLIAQKIKGATLDTYTDISEAFEDLSQGKVDTILIDALTALSYCSGVYKDKLYIASPPLSDEGIRLITLKGKERGLVERLQDKSRITHLRERWGLATL